MNNFQRQLLADKIDDLSRRLDAYDKAIAELQRKLDVKVSNRKTLADELEKLKEGVDW